ncbi:MAG: YdcF family protein [Treponema sp.]|nr:YdcF family protein [Treponema sp.]
MSFKVPEVIVTLVIKPFIIFSGVMCFWYFSALFNFIGYISAFNLIWIVIGTALILTGVFLKSLLTLSAKMHIIFKMIFAPIIIIFALSFLIIESLVFFSARSSGSENADYLIILGAGLYRGGPSLTLLRRINTAVDYAVRNPGVKIITSGGTGQGQARSEAAIMSNVLQINGIGIDRILIEDKSTNTFENLKYSARLMNDLNKKAVIVSSEFHLFRAKIIAKRLGYNNAGTLASRTPRLLLLHYYLREYLAVIKTLIFDR